MAKKPEHKVGLKLIAQKANVSIATVSMALANSQEISEQTRHRVRKLCDQLGYTPIRRQGADSRRAQLGCGFIAVGDSLKVEAVANLAQELANAASSMNVRLELSALPADATADVIRDHLDRFGSGRDGLLFSGRFSMDLWQQTEELGVPYLVLGNAWLEGSQAKSWAHPFIAAVSANNIEMGRVATDWLLARGHREIAVVCGRMPPGLYASRWADGYRLAMLDAGIDPTRIHVCIAGRTEPELRTALSLLAQRVPRPTAFVLPDSAIAHAFMAIAKETGLPSARECIVFGAHPDILAKHGLGDYATINEDQRSMAQAAINLLRFLHQGELIQLHGVTVPFRTHNFET